MTNKPPNKYLTWFRGETVPRQTAREKLAAWFLEYTPTILVVVGVVTFATLIGCVIVFG